ncbi:hypothetical protein [Microvirgula aerodenitrificans]|uniref:hypothetical protein n=1 Tax=Microvirgula aerodenitrificans TaxID=57480 RepID=UPI0012EBF30A|nr:hypothetical protein [Microvirgula aerodenitrificans]
MKGNQIWAILYIIYIIPFSIWSAIKLENISIREKIYINREKEKIDESEMHAILFIWCCGFIAMLILSNEDANEWYGFLVAGMAFILIVFFKTFKIAQLKKIYIRKLKTPIKKIYLLLAFVFFLLGFFISPILYPKIFGYSSAQECMLHVNTKFQAGACADLYPWRKRY